MHITVELEETTLRWLLAELLPITILLDDEEGLGGRWIKINPARHLQFSVDEGIRLVTSGELRWSLGPVPVTLTVQSLALRLRPVIVGTGAEGRLLFRPVPREGGSSRRSRPARPRCRGPRQPGPGGPK